ncbi:MAG: SurA N-terminal domain-containing protein [Pseudomonadota bacterium]
MLRQIRGATRGWISGVILFILAACFVIFLGAGNTTIFDSILHPASKNDVATVAGTEITPAQLDRELNLTLTRMRNNGQDANRQDAIRQNVHLRLLENLIQRHALAAMAKRLGIYASDRQIADAIRKIPAMQNQMTGAFDRQAYERILQESRYTEAEFENEQRDDSAIGMLTEALTVGSRAPASFGKLVLAYTSERRIVTIAQAPMTLVANVPAPTDAQLHDFYQQNLQALRTPEYRALTLVFARPADFQARVDVPEDRLRQVFQSRVASFTTPEKRSFVQISAPSQDQAQRAATRMAHGETPEAVAHALGLQVVTINDQAQSSAADANVATAVFAMRQGAAPAAVQGLLTPWAAVKLVSITPGHAPTFEEQRDHIRDEIVRSEARDQMQDALDGFDTARSAGSSVTDAARANHLDVVAVPAVDARGQTPDGPPAAALVDQAKLIQAAFATQAGEASDFISLGDGASALVAVDHITPASTRPFDTVKAQLAQLWTFQQRGQRLNAIVNEVKDAVAHGQSFATVARAHGLQLVATSQTINRQNVQQIPARALPGLLFDARPGDVVSDMRTDGAALLLAQVEDIQRTDPATAPQAVEQARQQLTQAVGQSVLEAVVNEAVTQAKVTRNEAVLRETFSATPGEAEGQ